MERQRTEGTYIKKGPWTAEEDEILINHVKKNGPRDWSSIRSKGLLPRTGKSCRLRWVNKLRPNLKTGCKFSAEEERLVIELQAQFGNKWAKIATYLPGRTDNDVKNFWSTRRKRLERILQAPSSLQSQKNKGKNTLLHQLPKVPTCSSITQEEGSSCSSYMPHYHYLDSEEFRMVSLPDLVKPNLLNSETGLNMLEATHIHHVATCIDSSQHNIFSKLPQSHLDHQLLPRYPKMETEPVSPCLLEILEQQGTNHSGNFQELFERLPSFEFEGNAKNDMSRGRKDAATFNSFFDDLPPDMLDYLEPLPSSSEL